MWIISKVCEGLGCFYREEISPEWKMESGQLKCYMYFRRTDTEIKKQALVIPKM